MSIDRIAPEALRLSAIDRALLAASLWESIGDPYELAAGLSDEDAIGLALERDAEIESGKVVALSHEKLMQLLRR